MSGRSNCQIKTWMVKLPSLKTQPAGPVWGGTSFRVRQRRPHNRFVRQSDSVRWLRIASKLAERPVPPVILHFLLILLDLLLHPVHRLIKRRLPVRPFAVRDEIVLMLGVDEDFTIHDVGGEIECEVDRSHPFKIRQELLGFLPDSVLDIRPQTSMSTSDLNLH